MYPVNFLLKSKQCLFCLKNIASNSNFKREEKRFQCSCSSGGGIVVHYMFGLAQYADLNLIYITIHKYTSHFYNKFLNIDICIIHKEK